MVNQSMATSVVVRVETPDAVAAKMPKVSVVVAVPSLSGWMSGAFDEVSRRIREAVSSVVSTREERTKELASDLRRTLHQAVETRQDVQGAAKAWCVTHSGAHAVEVLCGHPEVAMDSSFVSYLLDEADKANAMDRSRIYSTLAKRVLLSGEVLQSADGASRLLAASRSLPWQAPAHADIAQFITQLETDLGAATEAQRLQIDGVLGASVAQWVDHYANHERVAVAAEVGALSERPEVLERIGARAQEVHAIDPRLTRSLVNALIDNKTTSEQVLRPFVSAPMWTQAESMDLASRTGYAIAQRNRTAPATTFEP